MSKILYYLLLKPLSKIPLTILYGISPLIFMLCYHFPGYRRKTVKQNLNRAFPEYSESQIHQITKRFYRHFSDLVLETIRSFSMSEDELRKRVSIVNPEILNEYFDRNQSAIIIMAHLGNWELPPIITSLLLKHHIIGVYAPIKDSFFRRVITTSRGRLGTDLVPRDDTLRALRKQTSPHALVLIADQNPTSKKMCHWMTFLNQPTAVTLGPERIAKMFDYPVVFAATRKTKRGHYQIEIQKISDCPSKETSPHGYISEAHARALEAEIRERPELWLWTHKRWKRNPPADFEN